VTDLEKAGSEFADHRFVNFLIFDAIKQGASDIPHRAEGEDAEGAVTASTGCSFEAMNPPHGMPPRRSCRAWKIMANLDISERRLPQDGRHSARSSTGARWNLRMSTSDRRSARMVVCVSWTTARSTCRWRNLGFSENTLTIWKSQIDQPHGILARHRPTGSGKTTTLYSSLRCMDGNQLNISTVEDPIEYNLPAANQVQVHDKIGMSFSAALRSLLRQDPDVVMLGEIRDAETARIAVQAALTGHLVLSTLHTNERAGVDHATDQHRRRALPDQFRGERDPGPAAGSKDLPAVPRGNSRRRTR